MAVKFWALTGLVAACVATPTLAAPVQNFTTFGFIDPSATDDGFSGQTSRPSQSPVTQSVAPIQDPGSSSGFPIVNNAVSQGPDIALSGPNGSSNSGNTTIVAPPSGGSQTGPVSTVPLPSTLPMFGGALISLALVARRVRRRRAVQASR